MKHIYFSQGLESVKMRIRLFDFYFEYSQRHTEHTHSFFLTRPCSSFNEFTPFICTSLLLAGCLARLLVLISLMFSNNTLTLLVFSMTYSRETDMLLFLSHQPVSLLTKLLALPPRSTYEIHSSRHERAQNMPLHV